MKSIMHTLFLKSILVLFFFSTSSSLLAQSPTYKSWTSIGFEQKIKLKNFKFKIGISQGIRISDLVYNPRITALTEVGVSKKITKNYKLGVSYRASYLNGFKNRIALSNTFKIALHKKLSLSLRFKYQIEIEKNVPFSQDIRGKTSLKWNAHKDYKPYLFIELLYNNTYNYSNFNEYRLGLGLSADHKKKHNFNIILMFVQEINTEAPKRSMVLGLEYMFSR